MTMYCKIGEDLLVQVLSSLPPKALMRFKCVSKWWYAMISSPRFVAKHLSNSMHNNLSTYVLVKKIKDTSTDIVFSLLNFCNDNDQHSSLSGVEDIEFPHDISPECRASMIAHCDGIICLALDDSMDVVLWNPAIQEFKLLPPPPGPRQFYRQRDFGKALGFGYDPKSKDYKVINMGFSGWLDLYGDGYEIYDTPKAAIYTPATDSWREIKTDSLDKTKNTILRPDNFQIYFKGMCYWLGHEQRNKVEYLCELGDKIIRDVIILFDTGEEEFHDILLPESLNDPAVDCFDMRILVWNESIALLGMHTIHRPNSADGSFGIWVMDEFGGPKGAWTKHLAFELTEKPGPIWKSDEILMVDKYGRIFSYNLDTKKRNYLPILSASGYNFEAVIYVNSIINFNLGWQQNKFVERR